MKFHVLLSDEAFDIHPQLTQSTQLRRESRRRQIDRLRHKVLSRPENVDGILHQFL